MITVTTRAESPHEWPYCVPHGKARSLLVRLHKSPLLGANTPWVECTGQREIRLYGQPGISLIIRALDEPLPVAGRIVLMPERNLILPFWMQWRKTLWAPGGRLDEYYRKQLINGEFRCEKCRRVQAPGARYGVVWVKEFTELALLCRPCYWDWPKP